MAKFPKRASSGAGKFPPKKGASKKQTQPNKFPSPKNQAIQQAPVSQPGPAMQSTSQMGAQLPPAPPKRGIY